MWSEVADSPAVRSTRRSEVTRPPSRRAGGTGPNKVKAGRPDRKIPGHPRLLVQPGRRSRGTISQEKNNTQEDSDDVGGPADLAVQPFVGVGVRPDLSPDLFRERGEGEDVR